MAEPIFELLLLGDSSTRIYPTKKGKITRNRILIQRLFDRANRAGPMIDPIEEEAYFHRKRSPSHGEGNDV